MIKMKKEEIVLTFMKLLWNDHLRDFGAEDVKVPAVSWWRHAKHVDSVTQLQGDGHCEPASAQPRVGFLPERQGHLFLRKQINN